MYKSKPCIPTHLHLWAKSSTPCSSYDGWLNAGLGMKHESSTDGEDNTYNVLHTRVWRDTDSPCGIAPTIYIMLYSSSTHQLLSSVTMAGLPQAVDCCTCTKRPFMILLISNLLNIPKKTRQNPKLLRPIPPLTDSNTNLETRTTRWYGSSDPSIDRRTVQKMWNAHSINPFIGRLIVLPINIAHDVGRRQLNHTLGVYSAVQKAHF